MTINIAKRSTFTFLLFFFSIITIELVRRKQESNGFWPPCSFNRNNHMLVRVYDHAYDQQHGFIVCSFPIRPTLSRLSTRSCPQPLLAKYFAPLCISVRLRPFACVSRWFKAMFSRCMTFVNEWTNTGPKLCVFCRLICA